MAGRNADRYRNKAALMMLGKAADFEIADFCREMGWIFSESSLRSRRKEMTEGETPEIEWSGEYTKRDNRGRNHKVWKLVH